MKYFAAILIISVSFSSFASDTWSAFIIDSSFEVIAIGAASGNLASYVDSTMLNSIKNSERNVSWPGYFDSISEVSVITYYQEPAEPGFLEFWTRSTNPEPLIQLGLDGMPPGSMRVYNYAKHEIAALGDSGQTEMLSIDSLYSLPFQATSEELQRIQAILMSYNIFGKSLVLRLPGIAFGGQYVINEQNSNDVSYLFENGITFIAIVYNQSSSNHIRISATHFHSKAAIKPQQYHFTLTGRLISPFFSRSISGAVINNGNMRVIW